MSAPRLFALAAVVAGALACTARGPVLSVPETPSGCTLGTPGCETPVTGQACPAWVHENVTVIGPDGSRYATWHPAVDTQTGCYFGHEHGDDPSTSSINPGSPPFGYAAAHAGRSEEHTGYKVFVIAAGTVAPAGGVFNADHRLVMHMGTRDLSRYTERYHSLEYDYVAADASGREFHVVGMADTSDTVTTSCTQTGQGRTFAALGCATTYEAWRFSLLISDPADGPSSATTARVAAGGVVAAFDPITSLEVGNSGALHFTLQVQQPSSTIDPESSESDFRGCTREVFTGPNFFHNAGGALEYATDAFGRIQPAGPDTLTQEITRVNQSTDVFLNRPRSSCAAGIHSPN